MDKMAAVERLALWHGTPERFLWWASGGSCQEAEGQPSTELLFRVKQFKVQTMRTVELCSDPGSHSLCSRTDLFTHMHKLRAFEHTHAYIHRLDITENLNLAFVALILGSR